ncbi:hypothetical protein GWN63_02825 [Candidatus Bathyarchaeota archaeon]|nr:hypothetical protein [Candidatus Bathyarchaeota archaeon]NIU81163.1 hypothetical protein [Candidatus Bathyarchaeota archaeon]NIV67789.1 hypothetical protein [Candidatus Bathyarchaeota archaeon]NIW16283.1 hypothetical protein [Candidatus Bathyarchaeota archaeon]NIW34401.1 hypothetical protein [Candidatus Bathyarchaeota archaeon]
MKFLEVVENVGRKLAPGRTPAFTEVHIIQALKALGAGEPIGRKALSKRLGLGEGETRTLVKHLRKEDIIEVSRTGIVLSKLGEEVLMDLKSKLSAEAEVPESSLTVGPSNVAVLIKKAAERVRYGLEQRDAAIKAGAAGATTLIFRNNRLVMPGAKRDAFEGLWSIHDMLVGKLRPEEGDVVIIGSAKDEQMAEFAAKTAALKLLKSKSR